MEAKYFLLSDINLPVKVKIGSLLGCLPVDELGFRSISSYCASTCSRDAELYLTAAIYSNGQLIGMPLTSTYRYSPTGPGQPFRWDEWLTFPVKYRDLSPTSRLVVTIYDVTHDPRRVAERYPTGSTASMPVPQPPTLPAGAGGGAAADAKASTPSSSGSALATVGDSAQPAKGKLGKPATPKSGGGSGASAAPLIKSFSLPLGGDSSATAVTTATAVVAAKPVDPSTVTPATSGMWNRSLAVPNAMPAAPLTYSVPALTSLSSTPTTDSFAVLVGGTTMPLFNKKGVLKLGKRRLYVHRGVAGDGAVQCSTPYRREKQGTALAPVEKTLRKWEQKSLPSVKWLDKLAVSSLEHQLRNPTTAHTPHSRLGASASLVLATPTAPEPGVSAIATAGMVLGIEFPGFKYPIIYHQKTCNPSLPEILPFKERDRLFVLHDPEMSKDNPIETKYHKLARSAKGHDRDLKPNVVDRRKIDSIISSPNKHLSGEDKMLLWKFRYSLIDNKRALTKFLRCVDWADVYETKQATELLEQWAVPDIADVLELLSSFFRNKDVRSYAVKQLQRADNEELQDYLLQLVQALRYESHYPSFLSEFLIERCTQTLSLTNFFHWYVTVERRDKHKGPMFNSIAVHFQDALQRSDTGKAWVQTLLKQESMLKQLLHLSAHSKGIKGRVEKKIDRMRTALKADTGEHKHLRNFDDPVRMPVRPNIFVKGLIGEESTMFKSAMAPILACFKAQPDTSGAAGGGTGPGGTPPGTEAIRDEKMEADNGGAAVGADKYKVIFKSGDDLRQDQLMIQMINLMDSLLKRVRVDLKLTPYRVLATSPSDGFVEYVPNSYTLTSILDKFNRDIRKFFEFHNPKPANLHAALETFVKSCAGYCVITYILGIGDRHLDNLLLTTDGHLFHIDFGFIFGRDPKPFPPPMKFCKEMVEAMGGANSEHYREFRKYCCLAFTLLRPHANLILNLLSLMGDANIPDLSADVEKNLLKVQEKFRLDLANEEAEGYIMALIDDSVTALFPQVMEKFHKWALYWK